MRPCCAAVEQSRERERGCRVLECEQRYLEHEHEQRCAACKQKKTLLITIGGAQPPAD